MEEDHGGRVIVQRVAEDIAGRDRKTRALKQGMMQELLTGRTRLVSPSEAEMRA